MKVQSFLNILIWSIFLLLILPEEKMERNPVLRADYKTGAFREDKRTRMDLAMEQEVARTMDLSLGFVPKGRLIEALDYTNRLREQMANKRAISGVEWIERGPTNVGGRTRAIMLDPNDVTNNTIWSAGVAGGLWKTENITDENPTWTAVDDFFDNLAITSLAYDPSNTDIMYFGTGEGFFNADAVEGNGIWKSTDGGDSWSVLSSTVTDIRSTCSGSGNCDFLFVQKIVVTSSGVVLAATRGRFSNRGGIMRSDDGGSTWTKVLTGLSGTNNCLTPPNDFYLNWASDIEIGADGDIYAAFGILRNNGIWKSTDEGLTWGSPIYTSPCDEERIELAAAPSGADTVYALVQENDNSIKKIMRTTDGGSNWTDLNLPDWNDQSCTVSTDFTRGQAWYDLIAAVDPNDDNTIYIGGVDIHRSTDGGTSWTQLSSWNGLNSGACNYQEVHADQHAMVYLPGSSDIMYFGNDGGVYRTSDASASIPTFERKEFGFNTTQYYSVAMDPTSGSNYFIGGTQDNGTNKTTQAGLGPAVEPVGGDGGFAHIDQDDNQFQLAATTNLRIRSSTDGGRTFSSLISNSGGSFINPSDYADADDEFYAAFNPGFYVKTDDIKTSPSFFSVAVTEFNSATVTAITVSPDTSQRVFFGLNNGDVVRVDSAGDSNPIAVQRLDTLDQLPGGSVSCVAVEKDNEDHILVTYSNYGLNSVWESTDAGGNWTSVEGNLPDIPIRWALFDPSNGDQVLLATELGVWSTDDLDGGSTEWEPSNTGLANVRVDMLQYRESDGLVVAATHGRGLFTSDIFTTVNADFGSDKEVIYAEENVAFMDVSYKATSWEWDFGDGGVSTQQNPTHKYNFPGVYTVSLTINSGADTETKSGYIQVLPNLGVPFDLADGGNFEVNEAYFGSQSLKGGIDLWERGTPSGTVSTLNSGTNGWKTDLDANIIEADYSCALLSPNFNFTEAGTYTLSFRKSMNVTFANAPFGVQVQYSTDRGQNWSRLGIDNDPDGTNWYERGPSSTFSVDTEVLHDRTGFINNYTNEATSYDVSFLAGNPEVAFRFEFAVATGFSASGYTRDGFMIDDFTITGPANEPLTNITDPTSGTAIQCDGSSGYIQLSELVIPETFSASIWIDPVNTNDGQSFLAKHDGSGNDIFGLGFYNGGYELRIRGETMTVGTKSDEIQQLTAVVEKLTGTTSQATLYLNGTQIGQQVLNEVIGDATGLPWVAGQEWDGLSTSDFFNGEIEEIIFWSAALTEDQVRERLHLIKSGLETDLLGYWQFNEGSGTIPVEALTSNTGALVGNSSYLDSDFPIGSGVSDLQTVSSNGLVNFASSGTDLDFNGVGGTFDVVVSQINEDPGGTQPEESVSFNEQVKNPYFIVEQYDAGTFTSANLTLVLGSGLIAETDPAEVRLYRRGSNEAGGWTEEATANSITPGTGTIVFNGLAGFSQFTVGTSPGPLPVELVDFQAKWQPSQNSVLLKWKTAFEIDNDRFEIERSEDGETWETLTSLPGNGNSNRINRYEFKDDQLPLSDYLLYRLRQVDFDGQYEYSETIIVETPIFSVRVFPNPVNESTQLEVLGQNKQILNLSLFSLDGKTILQKSITVEKGKNTYSFLDGSTIPPGILLLRITGSEFTQTFKILKE